MSYNFPSYRSAADFNCLFQIAKLLQERFGDALTLNIRVNNPELGENHPGVRVNNLLKQANDPDVQENYPVIHAFHLEKRVNQPARPDKLPAQAGYALAQAGK
ncbi:MAG: hypothetical protein JJE25_08320 [Bacteroidia bacterium]|nr:hypothetical protein [Bacteroidia bacterium]